ARVGATSSDRAASWRSGSLSWSQAATNNVNITNNTLCIGTPVVLESKPTSRWVFGSSVGRFSDRSISFRYQAARRPPRLDRKTHGEAASLLERHTRSEGHRRPLTPTSRLRAWELGGARRVTMHTEVPARVTLRHRARRGFAQGTRVR